jgi:hypothetical protein
MASEGRGDYVETTSDVHAVFTLVGGTLASTSLIRARPALAFGTYAKKQGEAHQKITRYALGCYNQSICAGERAVVCALFGTSTPQMAWTQVTK